jgi:hypothetical protein
MEHGSGRLLLYMREQPKSGWTSLGPEERVLGEILVNLRDEWRLLGCYAVWLS